ncbi:sprouty-related, EVH1 domain-containing protein 1 [Galendromus occidentalis]|uniref:Sprouty-related, EVH1 domain-containing protein 1 n=1 Tax=Galendromus occidentalis TaxID=34638 RepID=A0AAJ7PB47_9ACAR|nr:sprouty-related, EVH1 domain-containing protein 1 [Galendromus occidentalis]
MSSEPSDGNNTNCLIRVRAQVMVRDDSTGGWVPLGGGGLSQVSVRKKLSLVPQEENTSGPNQGSCNYTSYKTDYQIYGKRISDQNVVLSCGINKDFLYNKVMPTFHHWQSGEKKYGLTFQTSSDARAFDHAVHAAVDDLFEHDVFMSLELPTASPSAGMTAAGADRAAGPASAFSRHRLPVHTVSAPIPCGGGPNPSMLGSTVGNINGGHFHRINYLNPPRAVPAPPSVASISSVSGTSFTGSPSPPLPPPPMFPPASSTPDREMRADSNSLSSHHSTYNYGHSTAQTDFCFVDSNTVQSSQPGTGGGCGKPALPLPSRSPSTLPLPIKKKGGKPGRGSDDSTFRRCRHCLADFSVEDNPRGVCNNGPDTIRAIIEHVTCHICAQRLVYTCVGDEDDDDEDEDSGQFLRRKLKRWAAFTALSFVAPCLCFYFPLKICHHYGKSCGLCGARHERDSGRWGS